MINEQQHNIGVAGYANPRTTGNTLFPNWEHVHSAQDRLIKKAEVNDIEIYIQFNCFLCGVLYPVGQKFVIL